MSFQVPSWHTHLHVVYARVKITLQSLVALTRSQLNSITRPRAVKQLSRTNWKQYCATSCVQFRDNFESLVKFGGMCRLHIRSGKYKALKGRRLAADAITATYGILLPLVSMQPAQHPQWFMMTGCCCFRLCWRVQVYNNVRGAQRFLSHAPPRAHPFITRTHKKMHKLAQKSVRSWVII